MISDEQKKIAKRRNYQSNYQKENCKGLYIKLNKQYDADLIEALNKVDNKQGLIKSLLYDYFFKGGK